MNRDEASRLMSLLFESWYSSVVRYAWRSTGSFEVAEDIVQEAFMALYRELRRGTVIENPKAWTLCVVRRQIGKHARSRLLEPLDGLDAVPVFDPEVEFDEVTKLLSVLSPREEEVLLLRLGAMKYREIASQLGISANSVNTLLSRALRKLQKAAATRPGDRRAVQSAKHALAKSLQ